MKVIDSVYINDGGGYIMLQYFISQAKAQGLRFFYLIDIRLKSKMEYLGLQTQDYLILKNSEISRSRFYLRNQRKISSVLTFGNVPPPIRLKCSVFTIFHNILIINNKNLPFKGQMMYFLKNSYIRLLSKNTDYWIIQSKETQNELLNKNWANPEKFIIAPFWKTSQINYETPQKRQDLSFICPCSSVEHKNIKRLIMAWESAFRKNQNIKLYITLTSSWFTGNRILFEKMNVYPLGPLENAELIKWYQKCEFVIFPSYCESFGLPLIEGIENGCKIIASDLPFTHSIIEPFMVFNPYVTESIEEAILLVITKNQHNNFGKNIIRIENKISQILSMIYNGKV
jgi:glycosyltransferase involved in cell wall biosynthesis